MSNDVLQLQQPLTTGGIRSVNFFNGRLLTGRDLTREQEARRELDARLGLALGDGVAFGLEIAYDRQKSEPSLPAVSVKPGEAITRSGLALRLGQKVAVGLTRRFEAAGVDRLFTNCDKNVGGTYVAGAGVYVLTIAPAELPEGKANSNALDSANVRCTTDATVEGVQFRLIQVKPAAYAGLDPAAPSFRNELAYSCFGAGARNTWFEDLLRATPRADDLLETLRARNELTNSDVPLALLFLRGAADLQFVDIWSVRRPLARAGGEPLPSLARHRRLAVGEAMFLQFKGQVDDLVTPGAGLGAVTALNHFRYLPPVGIIPVREESDETDTQATRFFAGMTFRGPTFVNAARLEGLIRESLTYPPIDTRSGETVWLHRVRENRMAIADGQANPPSSYLVFASGHLPYRANPQFDLAYFDYSNYAIET